MKLLIFLALIIISHGMAFSNKVVEQSSEEPYTKFYTYYNEYKKGQKVCFIFENLSGGDIILSSSAPWAIFSEDKPESPIFSPMSLQVITNVKNTEKKEWCWNGQDMEGKEVSSGNYFVRITFFDSKGNKFFKRASFRIKI